MRPFIRDVLRSVAFWSCVMIIAMGFWLFMDSILSWLFR